MKYTVLLLRPDYQTENFGQDTFQAHVEADDVAQAREFGQRQALCADCPASDDDHDDYHRNDYFVLAVYEGHLEDINPGE